MVSDIQWKYNGNIFSLVSQQKQLYNIIINEQGPSFLLAFFWECFWKKIVLQWKSKWAKYAY